MDNTLIDFLNNFDILTDEEKKQIVERLNVQRYKKGFVNLLDSRPDLFQRVPQHQIASYIGIFPKSISRMRKRIADKRTIIPHE